MLPGDIVAYYLVKTPSCWLRSAGGFVAGAVVHADELRAAPGVDGDARGGLSLWRICVPYLVVGFLLTGALFALNEIWVPDANAAANLVLRRRLPPPSGALGPEWQPNLVFNNDADGRYGRSAPTTA